MNNRPDLGPGTVLIADPTLKDPNFRRRVVLLCDHNEQGSVGLVLNQQTEIALAHLVEELPEYDQEVFVGGPVEQNILHVLHCHGDLIDGSLEVTDGLSWGGQVQTIQQLLDLGYAESTDIRFYLGYTGWGPGQLEDEIEAGGWILTTAAKDRLFAPQPENLWRSLLLQMGGKYALLVNYPDDPRVN